MGRREAGTARLLSTPSRSQSLLAGLCGRQQFAGIWFFGVGCALSALPHRWPELGWTLREDLLEVGHCTRTRGWHCKASRLTRRVACRKRQGCNPEAGRSRLTAGSLCQFVCPPHTSQRLIQAILVSTGNSMCVPVFGAALLEVFEQFELLARSAAYATLGERKLEGEPLLPEAAGETGSEQLGCAKQLWRDPSLHLPQRL